MCVCLIHIIQHLITKLKFSEFKQVHINQVELSYIQMFTILNRNPIKLFSLLNLFKLNYLKSSSIEPNDPQEPEYNYIYIYMLSLTYIQNITSKALSLYTTYKVNHFLPCSNSKNFGGLKSRCSFLLAIIINLTLPKEKQLESQSLHVYLF